MVEHIGAGGTVHVSTGDDAQAVIDAAGDGATIRFEAGRHELDEPLDAHDRQRWITAAGTEFRPTGDHPAIRISEVEFAHLDTLVAVDEDQNTTTAAGIEVYNSENCVFEGLWAFGTYDGVRIYEVDGTTRRNRFGSIYCRGIRQRGLNLVAGGENVFEDVRVASTRAGKFGVRVNDGQNFFRRIYSVAFGFTKNLHIDGDGDVFDVFLGRVSLSRGGAACHLNAENGAIARVYADTLKVNGYDTGLYITSSGANSVYEVCVDKLHSRYANSYGIAVNGDLKDFHFGTVRLYDNDVGLRFAQGEVKDGVIGQLVTQANATRGADGPAVASGVHIGQEFSSDGIAYSHFSSVNGDQMPENLTARTGNYPGERAYHDGTDGSNTNTVEPAHWNGSEWIGLESGSAIA